MSFVFQNSTSHSYPPEPLITPSSKSPIYVWPSVKKYRPFPCGCYGIQKNEKRKKVKKKKKKKKTESLKNQTHQTNL
jgi:hypothetical protein